MADPAPAYNNPLPVNLADLIPANPPPVEQTWVEGDHPTKNPDGVAHSNVDYWPKCQEEKATALEVDMVEPIEVAPEAPYPTGSPPDEAETMAMLRRIHSPMELVTADHWAGQIEKNLAAGGSVPPEEIRP